MRFVDELRDLALDHPDKPYLSGAADTIEQLTRDLKAMRQDNGAVIAHLQNELREVRAHAVELRPDTLKSVDERSQLTGLPRESIVNAILTAAFSFEQDDLDRIMRRGEPQNERRDQ